MRIAGTTTVCGIVGDPVAHTLSPAMHNAAFEHLGLDFVYVPWRVFRGATEGCAAALRTLGIRGINVTVPHKVDIMAHLDRIDPCAARIGAVNTIVNHDGELFGYNTDAAGFIQGLGGSGISVQGRQVVVMGAGGAARAVVFSLLDSGARVTVLNRDAARAAALAHDAMSIGRSVVAHGPLNATVLNKSLKDAVLLVNTTSVGMQPLSEQSPCPSTLLRRDLAVCDIVYSPRVTKLLREAAAMGSVTVDGIEMLVRQGAETFELWTGVPAPVDVMRTVVLKELDRAGE